ncbi:tyrosine-type recombinase/integrase [Steroidobacter flavus]|uniref:Tyrosine-type recombinase/integrase n=1 Tax=Steroidobacter flavus TaxID=1842136 RepID=A0ABV8SN96_9GAMM
MATNILTDSVIKSAKPAAKLVKLFDGGGLHVLIKPTGAKYGRMKYRHAGVEKTLAFGVYPEVSLKRAREKREEARLLDRQIDPGAQRKAKQQADKVAKESAFAAVAEEWFSHYCEQRKQGNKPLSQATIIKTQWLLNLAAYRVKQTKAGAPHPLRPISDRAIQAITKDDIAGVINGLKRRNKIETAHRLIDRLERVFRYAVGTGRMQINPAAALRDSADPRDKLPPLSVRNHPAITELRRVGELLRAIESYSGQPTTEAAMRVALYLFVRPGELRAAEWSEFDLAAERLYGVFQPLGRRRGVSILFRWRREWSPFWVIFTRRRGRMDLMFPSLTNSTRPMSENAITAAFRRMGYSGDEMTWHGFRTIASTLLRELGWEDELIERQLGHDVGNDVKRAYDKSKRLPDRRRPLCRV